MQSREAADTSTFRCATEDGHYATCNTQHATPLTFHVCLLLEKLPFFALSTILSALTFVVQQRGGAMNETEHLPLGARSGNALISYGRYVGKQFWPTDLAVFYPHPGYWPLTKVLLAGGLILGFSVMVWVQRQRFPYLLVGWLWFVGMLVPVIGLVHVGQQQAMADRYTYLPSLGVAAFAIWGAYEFSRRCHCLMVAVSVTGGAAIVLCLMLTRQQLGYWQDGETLFRHALAVTKNNWLAHNNLGSALDRKGKNDEALSQFQEVLHLKPHDAQAHYNLGLALYRNGQLDEAVRHYQEAIHLKPDYADAYYNLGLASYQRGRTGEALGQFQEALRLKPNNPEVHNNLGLVLLGNGKLDAAITQFQEAVQLEPRYATAHNNLGIALAKKGQTDEAIIQFQEALRLKPTYAEAHKNLGYLWTQYSKAAMASTLDGQGQYAEAIRFYQAALKVQPDQEGVLNNLAWLLATCPEAAVRNGPEAVRLATRACELTVYGKPMLIGTLAAAQAEAGDFQAAIATAERAAALATSLHLDDVAAKNRELIQLYRQGQPYHEKRETTTDPLRRRDSAASGPGAAKP